MKKQLIVLSIALLSIQLAAVAQTTDTLQKPAGFILSGSADVYYRYGFNENAGNNKTSFTNSHNSFELGMLSLKVEHTIGKFSLTGDVGFGKRADEFSYNDEKSNVALKQLFLTYNATENLKFTLGSFGTYIGYELLDAYLNRNYSMSYMFSYGPFFHTGLKVDYSVGQHSFMLGVFNPTDYKYAPLDSKKYFGAQYGFSAKNIPLNLYLNYITGEDSDTSSLSQYDMVLTYQVSPKFALGYNGTIATTKLEETSKWFGSAVYAAYDFTDYAGLSLRVEYFNDDEQLKLFSDPVLYPDGGKVWSYTLSGNFCSGNFRFIPELRIDNASDKIFVDSDGAGTETAVSLLMGCTYNF